MTNLDSILKSRDITLPTKVHLVKAVVFPVVMYGCESWIIKKAECQRLDAFEVWCWRRLLEVPWTARRSNQSILTEISPECSLEGLMLKLKLQYFGYLMWRVDSLEKISMEKTEDEMAGCHHRLDGREFEWTLGVADGQGGLVCCNPWGHKGSDKTEWLNWTEACHSFPSKKQVSFNFVAAVTVCSDFGTWENKICTSKDLLQPSTLRAEHTQPLGENHGDRETRP